MNTTTKLGFLDGAARSRSERRRERHDPRRNRERRRRLARWSRLSAGSEARCAISAGFML
jgi:hypothetical protein